MTVVALGFIAALPVVSVRLSQIPSEYRCSFCKTRTGDHAGGCPWKEKP